MGDTPANGRVDRILTLTTSPELPWPTMGEEAYHGLAGEVVRAIEPETEADPVALLADFLATFGCVVGRGPFVQFSADQHPPILWPLIVGRTGQRKGMARREMRRLFGIVAPDWSRERIRGGLSSGEGLIGAFADRADEEPVDKRLLVVEEEFARVLRASSRDGNTLQDILRLAWDGQDLRVMTRTQISATAPHLTLISHITPFELRRLLNETQMTNGFGNRFVWLVARRVRKLSEGGDMQGHVLNRLAVAVHEAVEAAAQRGRVVRSDAAARLWKGIYDNELDYEEESIRAALLGRAAAQCARLQLIYALLDGSAMIEPSHVHASVAFWRYSEASVLHTFPEQHSGEAEAETLLQAIRDAGGLGLTLTQQSGLFGRNKPKAELDRIRDRLERLGLIYRQVALTGGRPREIWIAKEEPSTNGATS